MDFTKWGITIFYNNYNYNNAIVKDQKLNREYYISIYDDYTLIEIKNKKR